MPKNSTQRPRRVAASWLPLVAASIVFAGCSEPARPGKEAATAATPPREQAAPKPSARPTPDATPEEARAKTLADAQGVVRRIYKDALTVEAGREAPFVVGDFNGDDSQDIAVVVRPARGSLPQINSEYAAWIVEDPRKVLPAEVREGRKVFPKRPEPVAVRQDDVLLAVIHGYLERGWRDPLASQTYLLRNAVGDAMKVQTAKEVLDATPRGEKPPALRGDVIRETLAGQDGFVYWTGAKYAWERK